MPATPSLARKETSSDGRICAGDPARIRASGWSRPRAAGRRPRGADGADSLALSRDNGYYHRILTQQGDSAKGGAKDYVADGKLSGGFAVVAYPAKYGDSGIMTFLAGKDGVVYQKNLGEKTAEAAAAITDYNPGEGWTVVLAPEPTNTPAGPRTARK